MAREDSRATATGQRKQAGMFHVKHSPPCLAVPARVCIGTGFWGYPMRLMSFRRPDGTASWGVAKNDGVIDLGDRAPSLRYALWAGPALAEEAKRDPDFRFGDIPFLPAIPDPAKI